MNEKQLHALTLRGTDVQGVQRRFCGNEELYFTCLNKFLNYTTLAELHKAISGKVWDDAFTAAHALKGACGQYGVYSAHVFNSTVNCNDTQRQDRGNR